MDFQSIVVDRTYLERDVPMFGPRIPAETLERLWTMLAHNQGTLLNASRLANSLAVSAPTVTNYLGLLVDLLLVRRLPPFHTNIKKRLVKSPKTYIRDSGLVHALLGIETHDELLGHPVVGASWEGFMIENLLAVAPSRARASFYRTARGAEIDLLLELGTRHGTWAIEIRSNADSPPKPKKASTAHSTTFDRTRLSSSIPVRIGIRKATVSKLLASVHSLKNCAIWDSKTTNEHEYTRIGSAQICVYSCPFVVLTGFGLSSPDTWVPASHLERRPGYITAFQASGAWEHIG